MRSDCKNIKLGDVTTFQRGLTYAKKDEAQVKTSKMVLRSNNIDLETHQLNFDDIKYLDDSFNIPEDKILKKGSIFMCMSNGSQQHIGKVAYIDKEYPYAFGGFMGQINPTSDIDGKFL